MKINYYHLNQGKDFCDGKSRTENLNSIINYSRRWLEVENLNFLIGSGCSLPAIPLMNNTFQDLINQDTKGYYNDKTFIPYFGKTKSNETINIEEYLDWLNQAINFHQYSNVELKQKYQKAFDYTLKGLVDSINSNKRDSNKFNETLNMYGEFYKAIFNIRTKNQEIGNVNVFTPNYDLFNEMALEKNKIHYTAGFRGGVYKVFTPSMFRLRLVDDEDRYKEKWDPVRRFVKLYKIHGSINWFMNEGNNDIVQKDIVKYEKDIQNIVDNATNRRMIYPYMAKHNLTRQSPYSELFREFSITMQRAKSVLFVIGYGFPDEHINQIIKQGLDNPELTVIIFGNREEENLKRFYEESNYPPNLHIIGGTDETDSSKSIGHYFSNVVNYFGGATNGR